MSDNGNKISADLLGIAQMANTVGLWIAIFGTILLFGECTGCVDAVEIIKAFHGPSVTSTGGFDEQKKTRASPYHEDQPEEDGQD